MDDEEDNWDANEEDIMENRIDYASADPWGVGGALLKQIIDFEDRAEIAATFGAAIGAVETAKSNADNAQTARDIAWNTYIALAQHLSPGERNSKGEDALSVNYPDVRIDCPGCDLKWEGSDIGGIAGHITSCSVKGHTNQSGELVSDPFPHFSCQSCPLSHQHYTFACRGGCGEMFREPKTYVSTTAYGTYTVYYDHGYTCKEDVSGPLPCNQMAFSCKTPKCSNDTNHLVYGECKNHKVRKGDTTALAAHKKLASPVYCSVTHNFGGMPYTCIITRRYECDPVSHTVHDFDPGPGTFPEGTSELGSNNDNTDCSHCTDGCSYCQ